VPRNSAKGAATPWLVVVAVGVLVVALVLALKLIPRLNSGQKVLDGARPAFTAERVAGDRAGIKMVSSIVDLADPIVTQSGGGAGEVPKLVAFVAGRSGLSQAAVLAALQKNFPHTTALLETLPLSGVTAELPGLEAFLAKTLKVTPAQLSVALSANFPRLYQSIKALPTVTNGWTNVPATSALTRFNGAPVRSVPDVRTYFSADVIPVLEQQRANFASLNGTSRVDWIAPLVLAIGIIVVIYGLLMIILTRRAAARPVAAAAAATISR
jgi:hypothetical protein